MSNPSHPYAYTLYGQHVHSNEPLPLVPAPHHASPSITYTYGPAPVPIDLDQAKLLYSYPYLNKQRESMMRVYEMELPSGPCYLIRTWIEENWGDGLLALDGSWVQIVDHPHVPRRAFTPLALGMFISLAIRLLGYTCLHASAVMVDGGVVAFTGPSETGKSTTLTTLLRHGAHFFSDDLVPLVMTQGPAAAYAGYPRVGLWGDSANALFGPDANLPMLEITDKRIYIPTMAYDVTQPWPIRAVYILGKRGANPEATQTLIVPLAQAGAVAELIPHTTGRILRTDLGHVNDLARVAALVRTVPVRRIDRPDDLGQLDNVAQTILADVARLVD